LDGRELATQITYLAASVLFILGLRSLTRPDRARRGMLQAALGMVLAIIGTLIQQEIIEYQWIIGGLIVGSLLGYPLGMWVPMTAMPQRIAFSHMFGALAATLVGVAEFTTALRDGEIIAVSHMTALGIEVLFGALTVTGSFIAFGKLAEILPGRPITYKGQNYVNLVLFVVTLGLLIYVIIEPEQWAFFTLVGLSAAIGLFIFILLTACGIQNALALAVFGAVADVLPYIGIFLPVAATFFSALPHGPVVTGVVLILMLLYMEFEARVIVPRVLWTGPAPALDGGPLLAFGRGNLVGDHGRPAGASVRGGGHDAHRGTEGAIAGGAGAGGGRGPEGEGRPGGRGI